MGPQVAQPGSLGGISHGLSRRAACCSVNSVPAPFPLCLNKLVGDRVSGIIFFDFGPLRRESFLGSELDSVMDQQVIQFHGVTFTLHLDVQNKGGGGNVLTAAHPSPHFGPNRGWGKADEAMLNLKNLITLFLKHKR